MDPRVITARARARGGGEHEEHAEGVVGEAFDYRAGGVDESDDVEVSVVEDVEALIKRAVAVGVAVAGDHGIDVDRAPDVTQLHVAADALFQDVLDSGIRIERSYAPFAEDGPRPATASYRAGDLVRVTLRFTLTKERRFVAATDPLPAGFEAVESWFATTAAALGTAQEQQSGQGRSWTSWWERGGFDRVERFDDRIQLFATRLSEGVHECSYVTRATTAGTFRTAPARAEEMYTPEVFGRSDTAVIEVRR